MAGRRIALATVLLAASGSVTGACVPAVALAPLPSPLVIAHRGASGHLPEHTLAAYTLGIELGADCVEPDLVSTRDGALVARHEPNLATTTDVAQHPEFADRHRVDYSIDGTPQTGWFASDFTLAEIRTLRARQAFEGDRFTGLDGRFPIPTLDEIVDVVRRMSAELGRTLCLFPELKHPSHHRALGLALEEQVVAVLHRHDLATRVAPVWIQSFEPTSLERLGRLASVRRIQLVPGSGVAPDGRVTLEAPHDRPADWARAGRTETWLDLLTPGGLDRVAGFAEGIGVWKPYLLRPGPGGAPIPTGLFEAARDRDLEVYAWTFRSEPRWLLPGARTPTDELRAFFALGVDGVFADFPEAAYAARAQFYLGTASH